MSVYPADHRRHAVAAEPGTMVQGKTERINHKLDQYREKPKEEWTRVEGTHECRVLIRPQPVFGRLALTIAIDGKCPDKFPFFPFHLLMAFHFSGLIALSLSG